MRTWTPVSLHGAEGALEECASGLLAALKRAGALCQQALRSRALRQATAHVAGSKRAAARRGGALWRGGGWRRWSHKGRGALGAAVEADMRSGGVRARRGEGKGLVRTLWGAVETGGRRMRKSN